MSHLPPSRRDFLKALGATVVAGAARAVEPGPTSRPRLEEEVGLRAEPVAMVHATDLFRPYADPDDHWDLACAYALNHQGRAALKAVLIDFPQAVKPGDPDVMAVSQMNYLTGQAVPVLVGSPRVINPEDAGTVAAHADLSGIRALLDTLRRSPRPVVISILGSARDVAMASKLEPQLFATKCAGIYLNAGSSSASEKGKTPRLNYNVALDPGSYAAIFQVLCPVYWMPCYQELGERRVAEFATYYRFLQADVLPYLSDRAQNYFAFMYKHGSKQSAAASDPQWGWLRYMLGPKDAGLLAQQGAQWRNMWCTAGFLHAVGLTVTQSGAILPRGEAHDAVFSFDPISIQCTPDGITEWTFAATARDRYIFHVRDTQHYQAAMTTALKSLLATLP